MGLVVKNFLIRRNLEFYSTTHFAKLLRRKGFEVYFPFEDKGIDLLTVKGGVVFYYQLKARTINERRGQQNEYWFSIKKSKMDQSLKIKNFFWVFCAVRPDLNFDFFQIDAKKLHEKWWLKKTPGTTFFRIKAVGKGYEVRPAYIEINADELLVK